MEILYYAGLCGSLYSFINNLLQNTFDSTRVTTYDASPIALDVIRKNTNQTQLKGLAPAHQNHSMHVVPNSRIIRCLISYK